MRKRSPLPGRLRCARLRAGLRQKELGIRAGIDEFSASARINQYEKGKHTPDYQTMERLAEVLGVPVPFFYTRDNTLADLIFAWGLLPVTERKRLLKYVQSGS
jgi:transcriptional regulator with XRE-family HTH domain